MSEFYNLEIEYEDAGTGNSIYDLKLRFSCDEGHFNKSFNGDELEFFTALPAELFISYKAVFDPSKLSREKLVKRELSITELIKEVLLDDSLRKSQVFMALAVSAYQENLQLNEI